MRTQGNALALRKPSIPVVINNLIISFQSAQKVYISDRVQEGLETSGDTFHMAEDTMVMADTVLHRCAEGLFEVLDDTDRENLRAAIIRSVSKTEFYKISGLDESFASVKDINNVEEFTWFLKIATNYGLNIRLRSVNVHQRNYDWEITMTTGRTKEPEPRPTES